MSTDIRVGYVPTDKIRFHPHNIRRDLGELRPLANSIKRFGVMQPVVVENIGSGYYRLRAGHRRVAAARTINVTKVPALIHTDVLDDDEWLIQSVQENVMRRGIDSDERRRAVLALRDLGCTWAGIGDAFGVKGETARAWADPHSQSKKGRWGRSARIQTKPVRDFITTWRDREADATVGDVLDALEQLLNADVERRLHAVKESA